MPSEPYILLVDDDSIAHVLTRRALTSLQFGGEFVEAFNGLEACECIRRLGPPLLILLDLRMPLMDGHEFVEVLSQNELCTTPPPVFVVSSSSRPEDQQLEMQYSFVRSCFEKPVSKQHAPEIALVLEQL